MPSHPGKKTRGGSHGGPHNAGQATKVYHGASNGKSVTAPKTSGNKIRGKLNGQLLQN